MRRQRLGRPRLEARGELGLDTLDSTTFRIRGRRLRRRCFAARKLRETREILGAQLHFDGIHVGLVDGSNVRAAWGIQRV